MIRTLRIAILLALVINNYYLLRVVTGSSRGGVVGEEMRKRIHNANVFASCGIHYAASSRIISCSLPFAVSAVEFPISN